MYKLTIYVPDSHVESLKQALFAASAGQIGDYAQCCWQVKGLGQFLPLEAAQPFIGHPYQLEQIEEWRVEMVLAEAHLAAVIAALKHAHPYQTPAFDVMQMVELPSAMACTTDSKGG